MRILHVAESIRGGCGTYLSEMLPHQIDALGESQLRCIVPHQHVAQVGRLPAAVLVPFDRASRLRGLSHLARAVRQAVLDWRPDVIHAHSTFAGAIVRLLSLLMPMPPVIYCPHGWVFDVPLPGPVSRLTRVVERWLSTRSARIVAISQSERVQALAAGIRDEQLTVIPNGVAAHCSQEIAPWQDSRLRLLFVGRLDRQKGADTLLDAVTPLESTVCVRIVGEQVLGGQGGSLPNLPHVSYTGWLSLDQVSAQINACDAVVMPSRWEGFGLVAVEAMRAAKPVLASAVGGLREIVLDPETGHLFPPDNPVALRQLLTSLDLERLRRQGEAGRKRFLAHYTSDRTHNELMRLYANVLGVESSSRRTADSGFSGLGSRTGGNP